MIRISLNVKFQGTKKYRGFLQRDWQLTLYIADYEFTGTVSKNFLQSGTHKTQKPFSEYIYLIYRVIAHIYLFSVFDIVKDFHSY